MLVRVKFLDPEIAGRVTDETDVTKMFWEVSMLDLVADDFKDWRGSVRDFLKALEKKIVS